MTAKLNLYDPRTDPTHTLPSVGIDALTELPARPGVYVFFGLNDLALYVGKSIDIRQRVKTHVRDPAANRHRQMVAQTERIAWMRTSGDLGAQLLEADLIKRWVPLYNRQLRKRIRMVSWNWPEGETRPHLTDGQWVVTARSRFFGLFRNRRDAQMTLRDIATEEGLCPRVLGLEAGKGRCFGYQIGRCRGACCGAESLDVHTVRARGAMERLRIENWPWPGRVAFREDGTASEASFHIVDHWHYQGSVAHLEQLETLPDSRGFDIDTYRILNRFLGRASAGIEVIPVDGDADWV
ncbi:GIY-YIG nuclease family protein [Salinicola halophilus]|uniref:GIY-YIG nuclease family protein n=1 Tax=Salinicola halophilus TaxID=184065 RepID=UPI000DA1D493|nr:GIY-YIG nuclease family protein [Salinicola halophilus]